MWKDNKPKIYIILSEILLFQPQEKSLTFI
jgi:hypothetical protein